MKKYCCITGPSCIMSMMLCRRQNKPDNSKTVNNSMSSRNILFVNRCWYPEFVTYAFMLVYEEKKCTHLVNVTQAIGKRRECTKPTHCPNEI